VAQGSRSVSSERAIAELEILDQLAEARRLIDLAQGGHGDLADLTRGAFQRVANAACWLPWLRSAA